MNKARVGLVWHGNREARNSADLAQSRFSKAARALTAIGIEPVPVVYNDDLMEEVLAQMLALDALQVWVNPIEGESDRSKLDQILREVASAGVQVHTHPDIILKMGTKGVLLDTKGMSWGTDVVAYHSVEELRAQLPAKLIGGPRVLKQLRGHSGGGIWKVEAVPGSDLVKLRHAQRGSGEETVTFDEMVRRIKPYFDASGRMIDQQFQPRLPEGMIRVYMVEERVGGFGHQEINALYPASPGTDPSEMPQPGPRLYYPPDQPEFQRIGGLMESDWIHGLKVCLGLTTRDLPLLWDADFMLGPKQPGSEERYVLCEINVSCVSPYPEWANDLFAATMKRRLESA